MNATVYRGVDVSKVHLDLDAQPKAKRFANTAEGIECLLDQLLPDTHLVCEATGGYQNKLLQAAWARKIPISEVMPSRVRAFAQSEGTLAKNDSIDAALCTRFGTERRLAPTPQPSELRQKMRALLRTREHVLTLQRHEANYREHLGEEPTLQMLSKQRLELYAQQIKELEKQIRLLLSTDHQVAAKIARMQLVDGIGEISSWTIWADLPELGQLDKGQAANLAGLAPHPNDSGPRKGHRFIQQGRSTLRRVLYMAAITASQHNPTLKTYYQRLRARGKPAKVALIAVARKLIELLNLLIQNPNFSLAS